jgi:hypothetical protein
VHSREKNKCKDCGGSAICKHGRQKYQCKDCRGSGICEHDRVKSQCKECGGSAICKHGHIKYTCKECPAAVATGLCEHRVSRSSCAQGCGLRAEAAAFLGRDAKSLDLTDAGCAARKREREQQASAAVAAVAVAAAPVPAALPPTALQELRSRRSAEHAREQAQRGVDFLCFVERREAATKKQKVVF